MGSTARSRSSGLYGSLVKIFPRSFQKHYSATMVQTFNDLLQAESSQFGRLKVWFRALIDLPVSAAKEHITNGKDIGMSRNMKIVFGAVVVLLLLANGASWWFGNLHARGNEGIEKVTVAQLADAMQQDSFYYTYGDTAVLFQAKVASITTKDNAALVTFTTNRPYSLTCQFPQRVTAKAGQSLSVAAPAGSAERQPHGVLLHNCVQN